MLRYKKVKKPTESTGNKSINKEWGFHMLQCVHIQEPHDLSYSEHMFLV
jgi:hypothetical protein